MGIPRKIPKLNWLTSFGLIIVAGTFYRLSSLNRRLMRTQLNDIWESMGNQISIFRGMERNKLLPSEQKMDEVDRAKLYIHNSQYRRIEMLGKIMGIKRFQI